MLWCVDLRIWYLKREFIIQLCQLFKNPVENHIIFKTFFFISFINPFQKIHIIFSSNYNDEKLSRIPHPVYNIVGAWKIMFNNLIRQDNRLKNCHPSLFSTGTTVVVSTINIYTNMYFSNYMNQVKGLI